MPLLFPVAFSSASHHLVHVMTLARTTAGINMGRPAQLQLKTRSQVEDCSSARRNWTREEDLAVFVVVQGFCQFKWKANMSV